MVQAFLHSCAKRTTKVAPVLALTLVLSLAFTTLMAVSSELTQANHSQCSDGLDNDNDGKTDYPQDSDCEDLNDDYEGISLSGNFVTVTDGKESVSPGGNMVYVITLKQQRQESRNVNVQFHLPNQGNIVSASDGGSIQDGYVRWTNVSVYRNVTRTITVNANVRPDATVGQYMVARVLVEGEEATDTTLVENYAPVANDTYRISITDGREFITPGQNLTYTVRVRNTSSSSKTTDIRASMPYMSDYLSISDGGVRDNYNVTWRSITLAPNEERVFSYTVLVDRSAVDRFVIRARAYAGTISAVDETVVRFGLPYNAITTTITDNRNTAEIGQLLTYTVKVTNTSDVVGTNVYINSNLPQYGEFISASNGGISDGNNVRWHIAQIAAKDTRTFTYTARVRVDAPLESILTAGAVADGMNGYISRDVTKVVAESRELGIAQNDVVFRKTADRSEAVPGGAIRYTLFIRNTLDHVISDAVIVDRFETQYLSFVSAENTGNLMNRSEGHMEWKVPVLKPGESWQTTYVLSVSENAPTGLMLDNVATLRGADVSGISLTERVRTSSSGVLGEFPTTGVGMDTVLALLMTIPAMAATGIQRKLAFGKIFVAIA